MKSTVIARRLCAGLCLLLWWYSRCAFAQSVSAPERSPVFSPAFEAAEERALSMFRFEDLEARAAHSLPSSGASGSGASAAGAELPAADADAFRRYSLEEQRFSLDLFGSLASYDRALYDRGQQQTDDVLLNAAPASRVAANAALLSAMEFFGHSPLRREDVQAGLDRLRRIIDAGAASAPVQAEILFWSGEGERALGEEAQAEQSYRTALARTHEPVITALVWFRLAELLEREQKYAASDSAFAQVAGIRQSPLVVLSMLRRAAVQRSEQHFPAVLATLDSTEALYAQTRRHLRTSARDLAYRSPLLEEMSLETTEHDRLLGTAPAPPVPAEMPPQLIAPFLPSEIALLRGSALSELGQYERATEVLTQGQAPLDSASDTLSGNPMLLEQARFYGDALRFERAWSLFQRAKYKEAAAAFLQLSVSDSTRRQQLLQESAAPLRQQGMYYDPFLDDSSTHSRPVAIDPSVITRLSVDTSFFLYNDFPERARFYAGIALARAGMLTEASEELLKPALDKAMLYSDRAQYQLALIRFAQHSYEAQKLLEPIAYEQSVRGAYASLLLGELAYRRNLYERAESYLLNSFANLPQSDTAALATAHLERGLSLIPLGSWNEASDEIHTYFSLDHHEEPGKTDEALFWLGRSFYRSNVYDSAQAAFERLLTDFPNSVRTIDAQYSYAWSLFAANDFVHAEPAFERVIALDSISRYAYDVLARAGDSYYAANDFQHASVLYNQAVDRPAFNDYRTSRALMMLGLTRMRLDSVRSALTEFSYITTKFPKSDIIDAAYFNHALAAYAVHQSALAEQSVDKIVRQYPNSPLAPRALYVAGEERIRSDDARGALPYYKQVIDRYPRAPEAGPSLFALQDALESLKRTPEALSIADTFVAHNPGHPLSPSILLRSGELRLKLGQAAPALASFQQFLKAYPSDPAVPRAQLFAARATLATRDTASAIDQLRSVQMKYDSLDVAADAFLDNARIEAARKQYDSAAVDYQRAFANTHYSSDAAPTAQFEYGDLLAMQSQTDSAIAVFTNLFTRYPIESSIGGRAALEAGELFASKKSNDSARQMYQRVLNSHGKDQYSGAAMVRIGEMDLAASNWKSALQIFTSARKEYALSGDAASRTWYGLARANVALGKKADARSELHTLLEMRGLPEELRSRANALLQEVQPPAKKKKTKGNAK